MKTTNLIIGHVLILYFLIFNAHVFSGENAQVLMREVIFGSWINKDYDKNEKHARWVFNPDGTFACYSKLSSKSPCWKGSYMVSKKWTDDAGKRWFKIFWQDTIYRINGYGLICIDQSGNTLEAAHSSWYYPRKIDRKLPFWNYAGIHHRIKNR